MTTVATAFVSNREALRLKKTTKLQATPPAATLDSKIWSTGNDCLV
jgi:hypothetical protein